MTASAVQALIEKWKSLPPQRRAQVEGFVDFLLSRKSDHPVGRASAQMPEPAFKAVGDNPDDADDRS